MKTAWQDRPSAPRIEVIFAGGLRQYEPGDLLEVRYAVDGCDDEAIRAVEHSVVWYTEGKGEEDIGVHFFERVAERRRAADRVRGGGIATRLPASPLSYEGVIVKIRWCVRIRIFFAGGRDFVSEHVFAVGRIPPGRPVS